jgi:acyl-coenzyme A synthetase/AMP-(fatty) acid ligase
MKLFLTTQGNQYTYGDLLHALRSDDMYYPLYQTDDMFLYFVNMIKALSTDSPLVLLDADLKSSELDGVDVKKVNVPEILPIYPFSTMEQVLASIRQSLSRITIFTSGTTGQPKQVIHTVLSLTRAVRTGDKYREQIWGYAYNPTHMAGLQVFFQAFENLNTLIDVFHRERTEVYRLINDYRITHISATPTFYRLLLPAEATYPSVVRATLGGEKSDAHLYDAIKSIFPNAKINNVYASTEAGSLFAANGDHFRIPKNIFDKIKIEDDELLIHKSLLGESNSFNDSSDYYRTGDLVEWIDKAQDTFRFLSRKNELINVGGYKVNPNEVENAILTIPCVKQVQVFGKPNSILGNVLCAKVVLENNASISEIGIRKHLSDDLQDFKIPRRIQFVERLPLTRTGKLKRNEI